MTSNIRHRLLPPSLFLLCLVAAVMLHVLAPGRVIAPTPFNLVGISIVAGGAWILLTAHRHFLRLQTNVHTFKAPNVLVTDGPFRFTRNPMYLGFLVILIGMGVCLGTLTPLLPVAVFFLLADRWYIPFEEAACLETFGADYERYRTRVRRWI